MSRALFTVSITLTILIIFTVSAAAFSADVVDKKIVITSHSLIVDNKNNTVMFEGSVVAKSGDITIHSDKMTVSYDNPENKLAKIHAIGNVKVYKKEGVIFADEAVYFGEEEKIVFTGNPKAVEGENIITGTKIIYYFRDDRTIVKESRVVLQNKQEQ